MAVYVMYICSCIYSEWCSIKQIASPDACLKTSCLFLLLFMGLRHSYIGPDTHGYCNTFDYYEYSTIESILLEGTNYGFNLYNVVLSVVFPGMHVIYLFIGAAFTVFSIYCFLKKYSKDVLFSQVMLLSLGFIPFFMTGLKQTLAMSILLYAYDFLVKRDLRKFLLTVFVAAMFHNSSIIFILAWPLYGLKIKRWFLVLCILAIGCSYAFDSYFLELSRYVFNEESKYYIYGNGYESQNNYTGLMIQVVIAFCIYYFCISGDNSKEIDNLLPI